MPTEPVFVEQHVDIPGPGREGRISGLQGFPLDRVQQRWILLRYVFLSGLWSRSLIFPVEPFKIFAQVRVHPLLRTFQLVFLKLWMSLVKGFFSHFSPWEKSAEVAGQVGADTPPLVSSWTPAAYEDLEAADEPAELEEDVELLIEEEDPSGWNVSQSASGRAFFWHRSSRRPLWHLPPEEKEGKEEEEEEEEAFQLLFMLHRVPLRLQVLCTWQSCSMSWCCLRCTPLVLRWTLYVRQSTQFLGGFLSSFSWCTFVNVCHFGDKPRCSASWSVWTRRTFCSDTVAALIVDSGSACARLVLLGFCSSCCVPVGCRQACDVRHHGRYGPEEHVFRWLVFLVTIHLVLCSFRADARHHGRYQKDSYAARCRAHCRVRQWHMWRVLLVTIFTYAVFPSVVGMLKMLCILVGMDLKDSTSLIVFFGNGMCMAGLLVTLHPALCSLDCRPSSSTTVAVHGWFCL